MSTVKEARVEENEADVTLGYLQPWQPDTHHFFVTGFDVWVTDSDLNLALKRFWKASKADQANVWHVPAPDEGTKYKISFYRPMFDGATFITTAHRTQAAFKKALAE